MAATNPNDLAKYVGILEARIAGSTGAYTRLACVRGLVANIDTSNVIDVQSDDCGTVFKVTDVQANVEAELLENMGRDTIDFLFTTTSSNVAGTPVAWALQNVASGSWNYNNFIKIANQNGNGSAITVNTVTGSVDGALVAGTDYFVGQNEAGEYGIFVIDSATVTTEVQDIDLDYDYTPNAAEQAIIDVNSTEVKSFEVKITATQNGLDRITTLSSAAFEWVYNMNYADIVTAGDITGSSLSFIANKGSIVTYYNEII